MAHCLLERIEERCGESAAAQARKEFSTTVPVELKEACEAADEQGTYEFNLLDDKKKK